MDAVAALAPEVPIPAVRLRTLQTLGVFCGFAAGAWLGGAEAPIKMVSAGVSPITVSLIMVAGVFLARWSIPALVRGTSSVRHDVRQAPHLIIWAVLAGCMWAVANTLTIYAIRDVGLSIAFPLWNTNSLLGIFWGFLLFHELQNAGWRRWLGVLGGALAMFGGATLLAIASSTQSSSGRAAFGVMAAIGAGVLWGTMYIPYRKAYLTGMNPLSFVTFFTVGELATMAALALAYRGVRPLWHEIVQARPVLFWLMLSGFVWVIGDLFQQYATKYIGISRGIPLSNTNQLWGLLWGILVFHELHGSSHRVYGQVIGGSILMALGAVAIALSSATSREHSRWQIAAEREGRRYGIEGSSLRASMEGREVNEGASRRTILDSLLVAGVTAIFIALAAFARLPRMDINFKWAAIISAATLLLLAGCALALWRTTRFN
ncbi:MAG TPA: GRP family sugar transporter [Candidatus Sulfotelmatobacter sp.]|nr:GRP family sugar transporter [Candidatus Sulfotelmatobacter sp.]